MSAERQIPVSLPNLHQECATCPFAERAAEQARTSHRRVDLEKITIECVPSGSGGTRQVKPGEWVDYESRTMTARAKYPDEDRDIDEDIARSHIPICPHYPIDNLDEKYPQFPAFIWIAIRKETR